jgi:antitoxin CptB
MSNIPPSEAGLSPAAVDALRRKLGFRAWHRGTREADLLIGNFADRHLAGFGPVELDQFDRLLTESDPDIYDWMTGRKPLPPEHENGVGALLKKFRLLPDPL